MFLHWKNIVIMSWKTNVIKVIPNFWGAGDYHPKMVVVLLMASQTLWFHIL